MPALTLTLALTLTGPGPGPGLNEAIHYAQVAQWNTAAASQSRTDVGTVRPVHPPSPAGPPTSSPQLARIRQCESGGNYQAVSPSGTYRGAYQFDYQTWRSVGGQGDPAAATPAEQDARAQALHNQRGAAPWPVCGR